MYVETKSLRLAICMCKLCTLLLGPPQACSNFCLDQSSSFPHYDQLPIACVRMSITDYRTRHCRPFLEDFPVQVTAEKFCWTRFLFIAGRRPCLCVSGQIYFSLTYLTKEKNTTNIPLFSFHTEPQLNDLRPLFDNAERV